MLFLSEAFTRPKVMKALAKLGFTQSYTYFTWRTSKAELQEYLSEITGYPERDYFRPNFFVNTPDILPVHLQTGEPWMFKSRVALAATLSSNYGIYNGFELLEHEPIPGSEEYLNSEKYEIKVRDWNKPGNIKDYIARLNRLRRENPALLQTSHLRFAQVDDGEVIGFVKESATGDNAVAVAIALSPQSRQFWFHFGDIEIGPAGDRGRCAESRISSPALSTRSNGAACACASIPPTIPPCCSAAIRECGRERPVQDRLQHRCRTAAAADDLWYKDAIIYQLHVKAFADSNGDGIGDFTGSPRSSTICRTSASPRSGCCRSIPRPAATTVTTSPTTAASIPTSARMQDFRRFMTEAQAPRPSRHHRAGDQPHLRPASLVQAARASKAGSDARNWYVWSDTDQKYPGTRIIFTDTEKSNWTWDPEAQAYYWHRFFSHQPDLNFDNPRVLAAIVQVMRCWLDIGVDGFRLDADSLSLRARRHQQREPSGDPRDHQQDQAPSSTPTMPGKVLLAEANQWPEDVSDYFGDGDECHMAYHFPLMPRIYMAIAQEDRFPIADILRQTPEIPANCQWALFLRNHDELTLEMVTDVERDYLWSTYANDPRARINLGIRRRLAPLMDNDRRKIELMNALLLSFPGTPIIYYGDEIGMGDNIYLGDRNGVRTPMQWTSDRNGGFSRCDPARLYLPIIMDPVYGYQAVNVEAQPRSLASLLSWTKRLIAVRRSIHALRPRRR